MPNFFSIESGTFFPALYTVKIVYPAMYNVHTFQIKQARFQIENLKISKNSHIFELISKIPLHIRPD